MREATLVLQSQTRVLHDAVLTLEGTPPPTSGWRALAEQVLRLYVAHLTGAPVHARTRAHLTESSTVEERRAVIHALERAIVSVGVPVPIALAAAHAVGELAGVAPAILDDAPRPSIVTAIDALATAPLDETPPPTAILRLRATTVEAAFALAATEREGTLALGLTLLPAAPDEMMLAAAGPKDDAVARLVRAASQWFRALPDGRTLEVQGALVMVDRDQDDGLRAAAVHAARKLRRDGLLVLDDEAFAAVPGLAEHPSAPRTIDPCAAFGHDRWELSAMLGRSPFVGRDELVSALGFALAEGPTEPRLVIVHGPPGIGKATLTRAALAEGGYADPRAPVLWGAADPVQPIPYAPIVAMIRALAASPPGALQARARLRRLLQGLAEALPPAEGKELLSLEKILAYLIGAADDEDDETLEREVEELSPRALRVAIRRTVLLVVEAMRARGHGRPAVLVVGGADAIDAPTADLLTFLARRLGAGLRVVFLSSSRLRLPRPLAEAFSVDRHEVTPLPPEHALAIVHALLDDGLDAAAVAPILEKARGSPFAIAQLVRACVEGGLITRSDQRFTLVGIKASALPGKIERVIAARIARLPDLARRTLGFASVLGPTVMPAAVEVIGVRAGVPREDISRALNLLLETGFLQRSVRRPAAPAFVDDHAPSEDPALAFEHPLVRAVAESELTDDDRARVHADAAEALLALSPSGSRALASQLARHYRIAGERARAVEHLLPAVRRAVRLNNRAFAIAMAKEGLALVGDADTERRMLFQLELERALEQGNDRTSHKDALKELVRLADRTGDARRQGQALHRVARFNVFGGDHEKAEAAAMRALERFRGASDARGQAQALRVLALARYEQRNLEGAVDALTTARQLVDVEDARALGIIEHQLGLMYLEAGDAISAVEHLLLAFDAKRRTGDPSGEAACLDAIADVYVRTGRLDVATSLLERAIALCDRIGDEAGRAESTKGLGELSLSLGDHDRALHLALDAQRLARSLDLERLERSCVVLAARAELLRGDPIAAEHLLDGVRRRLDEKRDPFASMETALFSAQAKWARAGRAATPSARERLLKTALERAKSAASLGETHGYATGQVLGTAVIGGVLHALGDPSGALLYAQRASELVDDRRATGLPVEDIFLTHARILRSLGDDDDARGVIERALRLLEARAGRLPTVLRARFWNVPSRARLRSFERDAA